MKSIPFTDPKLPDLAAALDIDFVLESLRRTLPECKEHLEIIDGKVADVLYKPGISCSLLYRIKVRNTKSRSTSQVHFSAQLLPADETPLLPPENLIARYRETDIRTPVVYLPKARITLRSFPVDESMPWLFDAMDTETVKNALNRMWESRNLRVQEVKIKPLGYVPGWRAALLYDVTTESIESTGTECHRLVAKTHSNKDTARRFAGAFTLWWAARGRINFALPVGYLPALHVTLQEYVEGGERLGTLAESPAFVKLLRQTATQIATLHDLSLPLVSYRTPKIESDAVIRWGKLLKAVRPDLAQRIENLCKRLTVGLETRTRMTGPVHGDFQYTNVLVEGDRITLIDLDELAYGDPLVDVGRLLASLRLPFLRKFGNLSRLEEARAAFLNEYFAIIPGDEQRARLFEAASLLISAASTFRKQRYNWQEVISPMLDECERTLEEATPRIVQAISVPAESPAQVFSFEERIRWAMEAKYIQAMLDPTVHEQLGAEVSDCEVVASRVAEQLCRIDYSLFGWRNGEKWKSRMQGLLRKDHGGRGLWYRLGNMVRVLNEQNHAPLLPRPIAYLPLLQMIIMEPPPLKDPFSTMIGTPGALDATTRIALALASFHNARIEIRKVHSLQDQLTNLLQKVEKSKRIRPDFFVQTSALFDEVAGQIHSVQERITPVLRILQPARIFCEGGRVAFMDVEFLACAHPLIDVGSFLAHLTLLGIQNGKQQESAEVADRFCNSYFEAMTMPVHGLEVFEAMALLGLACNLAEKDAGGSTAGELLARAETRIHII